MNAVYIDHAQSESEGVSVSSQSPEFKFTLSAARTARFLVGAVVFLVSAGIAAEWLRQLAYPWPRSEWFSGLFHLDEELNVPAWSSALGLLTCSILLTAIAAAHRRPGGGAFASPWKALSIIFFFLAVDEAFALHEVLISPFLRTALNLNAIFYHTWVIPYAVAVAIFAAAYWKFFAQLPTRIQCLFAVAGVCYVGGALGMEMFGGYLIVAEGLTSLPYATAIIIEETLELTGLSVFIYALVAYLSELIAGGSVRIEFRPEPKSN